MATVTVHVKRFKELQQSAGAKGAARHAPLSAAHVRTRARAHTAYSVFLNRDTHALLQVTREQEAGACLGWGAHTNKTTTQTRGARCQKPHEPPASTYEWYYSCLATGCRLDSSPIGFAAMNRTCVGSGNVLPNPDGFEASPRVSAPAHHRARHACQPPGVFLANGMILWGSWDYSSRDTPGSVAKLDDDGVAASLPGWPPDDKELSERILIAPLFSKAVRACTRIKTYERALHIYCKCYASLRLFSFFQSNQKYRCTCMTPTIY